MMPASVFDLLHKIVDKLSIHDAEKDVLHEHVNHVENPSETEVAGNGNAD
jgi:hypothetical protein